MCTDHITPLQKKPTLSRWKHKIVIYLNVGVVRRQGRSVDPLNQTLINSWMLSLFYYSMRIRMPSFWNRSTLLHFSYLLTIALRLYYYSDCEFEINILNIRGDSIMFVCTYVRLLARGVSIKIRTWIKKLQFEVCVRINVTKHVVIINFPPNTASNVLKRLSATCA